MSLDESIVSTIKCTTLSESEPSDWQCQLNGPSYVFVPKKGEEPHWFWRKMQYLAFGFRWVRRSPNG